MIAKPFAPSPFTIGIQALINRLHPTNPLQEKLHREFRNQDAGDHGEKYIFEKLQKMRLSPDSRILHNITFNNFVQIQIDILVITNYYVLILEVKNIKGDIYFTQNPRQLIRKQKNGDIDIFTNPEIQVEQYMDSLSELMNAHHIHIPIYSVIVFAYNNANIISPPEKIPVIMGNELPNFMQRVSKNNNPFEAEKIVEILLRHDTNRNPYPLCTYYGIDTKDVQKGVFCPICAKSNMRKIHRAWQCTRCGNISADAHFLALKEYNMLISQSINNKECREFLNLRNASEAKRILLKASYKKIGKGTATKYYLH